MQRVVHPAPSVPGKTTRAFGTWQGTLALVSGAGLQAPGYASPELRIVIGGTAKVTATDVAASNGMIHVIDTVLMPK